MTAHILASELTNLIHESKRRNLDLRNAAEKSLQDLKGLPSTSENQLATDLARRPNFISPFLIACGTKSARFAVPGVACLQRLAVSQALPKERLLDVVEAFRESSSQGMDVQLKILQALLPLLQNYSNELRGELLSTLLHICSVLQGIKNPAVGSTAAATLQQLIIFVFDRLLYEDRKSLQVPTIAEVPSENGPIHIRPAAYDAYKVFYDLCTILDEGKPQWIRFSSISQASVLELIEAVLKSHSNTFLSHPEQINILRTLIMPHVIKSLSERHSFVITLRVVRVLCTLLQTSLSVMPSECEVALSLLNHMLEPDAAAPWKRALCLEVFKSIYADSNLMLKVYAFYDHQEGKKAILRDNLSIFVRLSAEKPAVIGLGQHSADLVPSSFNKDTSAEHAALIEAGGVAGAIAGGTPAHSNMNLRGGSGASLASGPGLSVQWSTVKTPCLEQLDKPDPPSFPETYTYTLVLACMTHLSESLARFILPFTVHYGESKNKKKAKTQEANFEDNDLPELGISGPPEPESSAAPSGGIGRSQSFRKRTVPVNPLTLESHSSYGSIKVVATMIDECWPAVLATYSTFLYATLDADYFRSLVRSFQKFTQVAGLLRLSTARDALLTTLGKSAVPANVLAATSTTTPMTATLDNSPSVLAHAKGLLTADGGTSQEKGHRRTAAESENLSLTPRNLLCLRALINLAIALGPTLGSSWSIVLETLQQADIILSASTATNSKISSITRDRRIGIPQAGSPQEAGNEKASFSMGSEVSAAYSAASRLFESTADFPNDSFLQVLKSLCDMLHERPFPSNPRPSETQAPLLAKHQRRVGSFSGLSVNTRSEGQDYMFALGKVGDLASLNMSRLVSYPPAESGWDTLVRELISMATRKYLPRSPRLMSAEILGRIARDTAAATVSVNVEQRNQSQQRLLSALQSEIEALRSPGKQQSQEGSIGQQATGDFDTDGEIHVIALESLKAILEECGELLTAGWEAVFSIIQSVFIQGDETTQSGNPRVQSTLGRSSFGSLQLICSDFLGTVPDRSMPTLVEILYQFCCQAQDLNMSLTTITFFWNVSDFLHSVMDAASLEEITADIGEHVTDDGLATFKISGDRESSASTLWLVLLLRLTSVTTDGRAEVRNGSLHTIIRILDNSGERLSPCSWQMCFVVIIFRMFSSNCERQTTLRQLPGTDVSADDLRSWNETTKALLAGAGNLLGTYLDTIVQNSRFPQLWDQLLKFMANLLSCQSHALNTATYTALADILSKVEDPKKVGSWTVSHASTLWTANFPIAAATKGSHLLDDGSSTSSQEAYMAYVRAFQEIYRLTKDSPGEAVITTMVENLTRCIFTPDGSSAASYGIGDVDRMTPLQKQIIVSLESIRTEPPMVPSVVVKALSQLVRLPYGDSQKSSLSKLSRTSPTYVALSKASMELLERLIVKHVNDDTSGLLASNGGAYQLALESLSLVISMKYRWKVEGKSTPPWMDATSVALTVLGCGLPCIDSLPPQHRERMSVIWEQVVAIASGIATADLQFASETSSSALYADETFDLHSFTKLHFLMIPRLGASSIPDSIRRSYTSHIFQNSIIHKLQSGEEACVEGREPLRGIYVVRLGRTQDPPPSPRERMAYKCFSLLIELVSFGSTDRSSSVEHVRIAQAAAPYLILRAATVVKAYIADQPLRGRRMPQPESQRQELLFVLREMRKLESEPMAIPDAPGVKVPTKKHLHRLLPLLSKAIKISSSDLEVLGELENIVGTIGDGFGV
ncbi:hypothetical protein BDY21DRAFT_279340 [Lineolata rhizophorae]|uniref:Endosomal peripheral membrane protein n=1 Tax=Lineolata rhizophorae TaxID=578093 RepID=A0A6A6PAT4_9PEZI|nr:hypothetical protein BDY21DRAFT_279340 [Lineolata rhizophorae]